MAYSSGINAVHEEMVVKDMVASIFKQVIPSDNRMWLEEGLKIELYRDNTSYSTTIHIMYKPTARVEPQIGINFQLVIDDLQREAMLKGQYEIIEPELIKDFFLKMLMVYSIKEFEYGGATDGSWK